MTWFFGVLVVLLIGAIAVVAAGRGEALAPSEADAPDQRLPLDRPITGAHLREVRFSTAMRGYRASEVDALLARLAQQLDEPRDTAGEDREQS